MGCGCKQKKVQSSVQTSQNINTTSINETLNDEQKEKFVNQIIEKIGRIGSTKN